MALPPTSFSRGELHAMYSAVPQPFHQYAGACSFRCLVKSPNPSAFLHGGEGSYFPGSNQPSDTVNSESVVSIKPADSGMRIRYQIDAFTHIWLVEHFFAESHIYPGFMGKVAILHYFPFEPVSEDYSILDQVVENFEHGIDSILISSIDTRCGCIL